MGVLAAGALSATAGVSCYIQGNSVAARQRDLVCMAGVATQRCCRLTSVAKTSYGFAKLGRSTCPP